MGRTRTTNSSMFSNTSGEGKIRRHLIEADVVDCMVYRTHKELRPEDIQGIAGTYYAWRGDSDVGAYEDGRGFCKSATLDEVVANGCVLTPGRYVGAETVEDNDEPFDQKVQQLAAQLAARIQESRKLDKEMRKNLKGLSCDVKE